MKSYTVKLNQDFDKIVKEGQRKSNAHYIIYYLPSSFFNIEGYKVGISASKKLGNAPFRNRQKRIMREIIRKHKDELKNYHYVIIRKKEGKELGFNELEPSLLNLLRRIK